jgi:hypothetical protein
MGKRAVWMAADTWLARALMQARSSFLLSFSAQSWAAELCVKIWLGHNLAGQIGVQQPNAL